MSLLGGRFGTVDKAGFLVGKRQKADGSWDYESPVEVFLNPTTIKIEAATKVARKEGVANEETDDTAAADGKISPKGITEQKIDMTLIFNIVEAYQAKTEGEEFKAVITAAKSLVGGLVGDGNFADTAEDALTNLINKTDFTNLSLFNRDLCCYSALLEASHRQVPVVFYWGNMLYSGIITKFQTTFDYFSSQGAPLGAEVALTMISSVDDDAKKINLSTQRLLGLVKVGGRLLRQLPGA